MFLLFERPFERPLTQSFFCLFNIVYFSIFFFLKGELTKKIVGQEFTLPSENPDTTVGSMLALKLHLFAGELEELSDQSTKEAKMEKQLAELKERWHVVEWFKEPYGGDETGTVNLLNIAGDDFEMLENDQLTIQGMMGSRYLATFEEEVTQWQRELAGVADVMVVLSDNQRVWSYLEPLFMKSKEVREELPEDAARFKTIDGDVKIILKTAETTKFILPACNVDGLYDELEQIQERLSGNSVVLFFLSSSFDNNFMCTNDVRSVKRILSVYLYFFFFFFCDI